MKTKECEVHFNVARYEHQRKLAENETTRSRTLSAQVNTFSQTETELRSQLNIYVEKFKQVSEELQVSLISYGRHEEIATLTNVEFPRFRLKTHSTTPTTCS